MSVFSSPDSKLVEEAKNTKFWSSENTDLKR